MSSPYDTHHLGPARGGAEVTPNDDADLPRPAWSLYIGTGGDVAIETMDGTELVFAAVPTGTILPIVVKRVLATGTDADDIIALH